MKEKFYRFLEWCKSSLYRMEDNVTKYHYLFLSLFAGFCLGVCPVFGFILGYNYERAKEGKADLVLAVLLILSAVVGSLIHIYFVI